MEANEDEWERCIEISAKAFAEGKLETAKKFLNEAERLYYSDRAKKLLTKIKRIPKPNETSGRSGSGTNAHHQRKNATLSKTESKPSEFEYTPEQLEAVKRIKKCKDPYEILMVTKGATVLEIKKAYRKLALQLHPDKNKAPGSAEAFMAIRTALRILTAPGKSESKDTNDFSRRPTGENRKTPESSNNNNRDCKPSCSNHDYKPKHDTNQWRSKERWNVRSTFATGYRYYYQSH